MWHMDASTWVIALRTLAVYGAVFIGLRLMGKREIGQMTIFDLVVILLIAAGGKLVGGYAGARMTGLSPRKSGALAALVNTRGLTELVILTVGLQSGVLDKELYSLMVVMALVTTFKREWSAVTAPVYALLEGLFLGGLSAMLELRFPGIAIEAVALTFGTAFCMLMAYRSGLIRATQKFTMGIAAATGGIALVYLVTMVIGFFGVQVPLIYGSGPIGILFSLVVVVIAALNLILDFSVIEEGAANGAPRYMEWFAAFGLMVTLIWLYLEMIRLLSKLRDDRR